MQKTPHNISAEQLSSYEEKLLLTINHYRIRRGLQPLKINQNLQKLAKRHSTSMARKNSLNHHDFDKRFEESKRSSCVENVGWNYSKPESQFEAWKASREHNRNLLHSQIKYAGIAKVGEFVTFFACS